MVTVPICLCLFILFSNIIPIFGSILGSDQNLPIPNQQDKTLFIPRALTFLGYYFELRSNWPKDEPSWKDMLPIEREVFNRTTKKFETEKNPHWETVLTQSWEHTDRNGEMFRQTAQRNPVFRMSEYAGKEVCSQMRKGEFITVQLFPESGLPFEVPCLSCSQKSHRRNSFHLLPKRDFYTQPFDKQLEKYPNRTDVPNSSYHLPVQSLLFRAVHSLIGKDVISSSSLIQSVRRDVGGQIREDENSCSTGNGRLQIDPSNDFYRTFPRHLLKGLDGIEVQIAIKQVQEVQAVKHGATFQCVESKDGIEQATNVVVNVDSLVATADELFSIPDTFELYEKWDNNWNLTTLAYSAENIRLKMTWEPWSCCSACCCNEQTCGERATDEHKCHTIYSVKTRKGHLSMMRLNPNKPVYFDDKFLKSNFKEHQAHLAVIFDHWPYLEKGIPLFSSIIPALLRTEIHKRFTLKFLTMRNSTANMKDYKGAGLFIQTESCQSDPQKKDCARLAKCRGLENYEEKTREKEVEIEEVDPCDGYTFKPLVLDSIQNEFEVEANHSYRLMIDDTVYHVGNAVNWKIHRRKVPFYDFTKSCHKQGQVVHPNGLHLLLTNLPRKDLKLKVLATLHTGQTLAGRFNDVHEGEKTVQSTANLILWGFIILLIVILLVLFVFTMYKIRVHRVKKSLDKASADSKI